MAIRVIPFVREDLTCTYRVVVEDRHIDMMGHMNVSHYTEFVAHGFWYYLRDHILGGSPDVSKHSVFMIEQHLQYLAECHVGEAVEAYVRVVGVSKRCVHVVCYLYNETQGRLCAYSEILLIGIDMQKRKGGTLGGGLREKFAAAAAEHKALSWAPSLCGVIKPF